MKKRIYLVVCMLAIAVLLTACGVEESGSSSSAKDGSVAKALEGTWILTDVRGDASSEETVQQGKEMIASGKISGTLVIRNGRLTVTNVKYTDSGERQTQEESIQFTTEGSKLMEVKDGKVQREYVNFYLNGDTLELGYPVGYYVYTRQGGTGSGGSWQGFFSSGDNPLQSNSIEGTWKLTDMKTDSSYLAANMQEMEKSREQIRNGEKTFTFTFRDGEATLEQDGDVKHGSYQITIDKITITIGDSGDESFRYKVSGDTLELSYEGPLSVTLVFKRQD